ncbi:SMP-30/gluconolactonase/LRE family protein [Sphingomonas sp. HITSZ_GF]|uniref:SMP-30/gluconolactonase/LRE family protein n=1 Tax=Sphingomonas sp. HITSZ_GF TaxID=3037247 RepID=UPI00240CF534|nr:SMP-30/gluconolactonase/LRE family protein [Sphingomonas sp. HITSZ_GF]MDG2534236.1 SMP-30/gluconolactonase/LRE family protein [Sphingomonas sp. HITSZ_GF]
MRAQLGESPIWDAGRGRVHWLDIPGRILHGFDPVTRQATHHALAARVTAIALCADGGLIGCGDAGVVRVDPDSGRLAPLAPLALPPGMRCNDGAVAPDGSFWFGTMAENGSGRPGQLLRYDPGGGITCIAPDILVPNGPAFLPDGRVVIADTAARVLWALDADGDQAWDDRQCFARFDPEDGKPDGMAIDREGNLWIALWDGACLRRFAADGTARETLALPVRRPTRPAFGGADHDKLFVTSAAIGAAPGDTLAGVLLEAHPIKPDCPRA